jgi:hypothetical protein
MNKELKILGNKILNNIKDEADDCLINIDGVLYKIHKIEEEIDDQGEFQNVERIFEVLECVKNGSNKKLDIFIMQNSFRYGDCYSGYDYEFDKPYLVHQVTKVITTTEWEVVK